MKKREKILNMELMLLLYKFNRKMGSLKPRLFTPLRPQKLQLRQTTYKGINLLILANEDVGWRLITRKENEKVEINFLQNMIGRKDKSLIRALDVAVGIYEKMKLLDEVLWQKYEDVISDVPTAIRTQAQFLGINPSDEIISAVAERCSIERAKRTAQIMKNKYQSKFSKFLKFIKMSRQAYDKMTLLHPDHISETEGAVEVWRTKLEQDEIDEITERYSRWLCETEYLR